MSRASTESNKSMPKNQNKELDNAEPLLNSFQV